MTQPDNSRWWHRHLIVWVAAAYGLFVYLALPVEAVALNDDFGYLRSVIETLQRARPWTNDWLEPWAASLSVLSALVFKLTGSFHVATQGVQAVGAAMTVAGAAVIGQDRGLSRVQSAVVACLLVSCPTLLWKSVEFTAVVIYLPCLLWSIWAAGRRQWGVFFIAWLLACASRQSAVTWLVLPGLAFVEAFVLGRSWRRPAVVLAAGVAWVAILSLFMNRTQSQAMVTAHLFERLETGACSRNLLMGAAIILGSIGCGRFVAIANRLARQVDGDRPARVLGVLVATAVVLVALGAYGRMYFEHESFGGGAGHLYAALVCALAVAGWILGGERLRRDLLLASAASLVLVVVRTEVWDYYYLDVALFGFSAAVTGPGNLRGVVPAGWSRGVLVCCLLCGGFHLYFSWATKCRVDRESAVCRLAETALRRGALDVTELSALPYGFVGWQLHPYYVAHDGRQSVDIGGFLHYLRDGSIEVRRSPLRFWSDSKSLKALTGEDAARVIETGVARVGWFWHERCSLLRRPDDGAPARRNLDRALFRPSRFPLNEREWRELVEQSPTSEGPDQERSK